MLTALLLAESGIRVKIIDQESRTATHSYACALHSQTLKLLEHAGLAADVQKLGHPVDAIAFYEGKVRRAELKLSELLVGSPGVVVLPQSALENLLERRLNRIEHVELDWNCRLSDLKADSKAVVATIDKFTQTGKGYGVAQWESMVDKTFQTSADFVVGADGSNSHVRQCLGIEYDVAGDRELFVVYEFETGGKCGHEMKIVLGDNTTSVMWPLSDNKCRWSFQIMPADAPGDFPGKDRSAFTIEEAASEDDSRHHLQRLIEERAPWFEGTVKELNWSTDIQFEHRLVRQFGRNRCWLAGDAAHQTGPVGMQSLNVGLREAADLAGRAKKILREKASEELLQAYNSDRRADWQRLLGLGGGPTPAESADPWIKQHRAKIPPCLPASGEDLTVLLKRLGLDFN
jgi:3-(3-hydroxy-phenyl)propionate hydroxylase